jgi:hypothetical protein
MDRQVGLGEHAAVFLGDPNMTNHPLLASAVMFTGFAISGAAAAQDMQPTPVSASATQPADDACLTVAGAKNAQWTQDRLMIRETKTLADGSKRQIEAIFTPSNAYGHEVGKPWMSMNIVTSTRNVQPASMLKKSMGLADCQTAGKEIEAGKPSFIIAYNYLPTHYIANAQGKIWIADDSGLPLHQEYSQSSNTETRMAVAVTSDYLYGNDVQVPAAAEESDELRRFLAAEGLYMHGATGGGFGPSGTVGSGGGHHK